MGTDALFDADERKTLDRFVRVPLKPTAWMIECPECVEEIDLECDEVRETIEGNFEPDTENGAQFRRCDCGALIEIVGVRVVPDAAPGA